VVVGIVSNLNRRVKRIDVFLKAAAYVAERRSGFRFVIIGDGEFKDELIAISKTLGIQEVVDFAGRIVNVKEYLKCVDIGVLSSDSEGFSNAILEYMASGVPVVATAVGGNKEAIVNGVSGFLVPPGDYRAMGERIIQLADERETYLEMQRQGLACVLDKFSLEKALEAYQKFYGRVMARRMGEL